MSIFASQVTESVELPSIDLVVVIRKLSGSSLRKAREVRSIDDMKRTRNIGADVLRMFDEMAKERDSAPQALTLEQRHAQRYARYDRDDMIVRGSKEWSRAEPMTTENLLDLPEPEAERLFRRIVDLAEGPIDEAEAKEGKDAPSSPSTESSTT